MKRALMLLLLLAACDAPDPCDGRRDLATSPLGLELTPEEHPAGWGDAECAQCHQAWAIHTADCSSSDIDVASIDEQADLSDPMTCVSCHGTNGSPELEEAP